MPHLPAVDRLKKFIDDVSAMYLEARSIQVRFARETGRRIVEEEQNGEMRAQYGASLLKKMSEELSRKHGPGFSVANLRRMRQFYLQNQKRSAPSELDWTDYVELMPVKDDKVRKRLEQRAIKEGLNSRQLRREVRAVRGTQEHKGAGEQEHKSTGEQENKSTGEQEHKEINLPPLKRPSDLTLNTFAESSVTDVTEEELGKDEVLIDCGFFVNRPVKKTALKGVTLTNTPSYTYAARVERVVDGDTLVVVIRAGFGNLVREKLRLRGIDTPELKTPEGERAKRYVQRLLPVGSWIVLKSHKCKTDTHGRFVADVFYRKDAVSAKDILADPVYLNQQLLDEGYAQRMEE